MNAIISETKHGFRIEIKPETSQDLAMMLRLTKATKKQVPEIFTSFSQNLNQPYCAITLEKKLERNQNNYINND